MMNDTIASWLILAEADPGFDLRRGAWTFSRGGG